MRHYSTKYNFKFDDLNPFISQDEICPKGNQSGATKFLKVEDTTKGSTLKSSSANK